MLPLAALLASMNLPAEPKPYTVEFRVVRLPHGSVGLQRLLKGRAERVLPADGDPINTSGLIDASEELASGRVEMRGPRMKAGLTPTMAEVTDNVWLIWPGCKEPTFGSDFAWSRQPRTYIARTPCMFTVSAVAAQDGRIELTVGYAAENLTSPEHRRPLPPSLSPFYTSDAPPPRSFVPALHQQLKVSDTSRSRVTGRGMLKVGETLAVYAGCYATWPASDELLVPYHHQWGMYNFDALDDVIVFATVRE
jgi:hypothetical protein